MMPTPSSDQPSSSDATGRTGEGAPTPIGGVDAGDTGGPRILCPYCGVVQRGGEQCVRCRGLFEPLSRQATQNVMGPWHVRDEQNPFLPGVSYEKLREMAQRGKLQRGSIVRGPSTRQFWSLACNTAGVAVLLGECHHCHAPVASDAYMCRACGVVLTAATDRQHLGLAPVKLLPGDASAHEVASVGMTRAHERPAAPPRPAHPNKPPTTAMMVVPSAVPPPLRTTATASTMNDAAAHERDGASAHDTDVRSAMSEAGARASSAAMLRRRRRSRASAGSIVAWVVFGAVLLAAGSWAIFARETPIDGAIRAVLGDPAHRAAPTPTNTAEEASPGPAASVPSQR
jgi:hypothetical protein